MSGGARNLTLYDIPDRVRELEAEIISSWRITEEEPR